MTAVFAGVPAMTRAMDVAQQVLDPKPERERRHDV